MHCEYDSKKRATVFSVLEASSLVYIIAYLCTYFNLTSSQCVVKRIGITIFISNRRQLGPNEVTCSR